MAPGGESAEGSRQLLLALSLAYAAGGVLVLGELAWLGRFSVAELALGVVLTLAGVALFALVRRAFRLSVGAGGLAASLWLLVAGAGLARWSGGVGGVLAGAGLVGFLAFLPVYLYAPGEAPDALARAVSASLLAIPLLVAALSGAGAAAGYAATVLVVGGASAWVWSAAGVRVARWRLLGYLYDESLRLVRVAREPPSLPPWHARAVVRMAGVPFLFALAVAALVGRWLPLGDAGQVATITLLSLPAMVLASAVVPGKWLLDALHVHILDEETWLPERPDLPPYLAWLVGVGALGLLFRAMASPPELLQPGRFLDLVSALLAIVVFLFPVAHVATIVYLRTRGPRDLARTLRDAHFETVESLRELALREMDEAE